MVIYLFIALNNKDALKRKLKINRPGLRTAFQGYGKYILINKQKNRNLLGKMFSILKAMEPMDYMVVAMVRNKVDKKINRIIFINL